MNIFRQFLLMLTLMIVCINTVSAGTLLVANVLSNSVSLIDDKTLQPYAELITGFKPHEVAVSPDRSYALVSNFGTVVEGIPGKSLAIIDIRKAKIVKKIQLTSGSRPHGICFISNNEALVTEQGHQVLLLINIISGTVMKQIALPGEGAHMVTTDLERKYAYIANDGSGSVSKLDLRDFTIKDEVGIGRAAEGIVLTPNEEFLLVTNRKDNIVVVLRTKNLALYKTIHTDLGPIRVAICNHGQSALVTNSTGGSAQLIDLLTWSIDKPFKTTLETSKINGKKIGNVLPVPNSIVVRDDQVTAYITHIYAGNITLVDLMTKGILRTFEAGKEPDGLAYSE